ncbi:hypothetical protein KJ785_00735 [Patescibacteria group bacterium]|nr:hypothetical protein [Patescibacteria group bacterium]
MKLRTCSKCSKNKKEDEFNWKNKKRGWRNSFCKVCHSDYRRSHYEKNRKKYISKARKWNGRQTKKLREFVFKYLEKHPCVDCGEKDIRVLDFDHLRDKKMGIASMVKNCYSIKALEKEIEKCLVRCANCHRRKTAIEGEFWKNKMGAW